MRRVTKRSDPLTLPAEAAHAGDDQTTQSLPAPPSASAPRWPGRGAALVARLRGRGDPTLDTDTIMALTRGEE